MWTVLGEVARHHLEFLFRSSLGVRSFPLEAAQCPGVMDAETHSKCSLILLAIQQQKTNVSWTPVEVRNSRV